MTRYATWHQLPPVLQKRLQVIRPLVLACFARGVVLDIHPDTLEDVREFYPGVPAHWSGPALYIPWQKVLAMTASIAYGTHPGYGTYRGDLHEWGHAVWSVLLTTAERWFRYYPAWLRAKWAGRLLDDYSATGVEEGWAQDVEAYFTTGGAHAYDHGRDDLRRDPVRYGLLVEILGRYI